jgi:tRNA(Ile)-lysidine synthetase-like protein
MNEKFVDFIQNFSGQHLAVAVSGGVDSICLLHWLCATKMNIVALHVHHHLRDVADVEADYVSRTCKALGVPCHIFHWVDEKPTTGIEAAARTARYKFMTDFCRQNNIDALMIAHQADDQIETFLMNLARGSGVVGLAGMQTVSYRDGVKIVRPLLNVFRHELIGYCKKNNIMYFDDEMKVSFRNPLSEQALMDKWLESKLLHSVASMNIYRTYCPSCKHQAVELTPSYQRRCGICGSAFAFYRDEQGQNNVWFLKLRRQK